jgi:transposase
MDVSDYERHLIGQLCWRCHEATRPSHRRQRRCPACRRKWGCERRRVRWELLKASCLTATAHHAARQVRCACPTAYRASVDFRAALARLAAEEGRPLLGELEPDGSYFGGNRKGKRGRGAAVRVAVFGVPERAGRVDTVAVPDCKKETLMARIEAATLKGPVFYTGEFTGYNDLSRFGKHVPIGHGEVFADGPAHIDGIEGSWSYAKRLQGLCHGVDREDFPLYLAEDDSRYNHREEHLPGVLYKAPIPPQLIKDGLA